MPKNTQINFQWKPMTPQRNGIITKTNIYIDEQGNITTDYNNAYTIKTTQFDGNVPIGHATHSGPAYKRKYDIIS